MNTNAYTLVARLLRMDAAVLGALDADMVKITGHSGVITKLAEEMEIMTGAALSAMQLERGTVRAGLVRSVLVEKLKETDRQLWELFRRPNGETAEGLKTLLNFARESSRPQPVFVLKKEKAIEMLKNNPPPNMMQALGYKRVDELLEKESLMQVMCALRFVETTEWMHENFEKNFSSLSENDFEERDIEVVVLDGKWLTIAEKFVKKKYHNVSHLKEFGVVFVIPLTIDTPGETLRLFGLILHYLYEVQFYAELFKRYVKDTDFVSKVKSLLRGDVLPPPKQSPDSLVWLIVQRYLAKDDEKDPRLFLPHVNSEAIHWKNAQKAMWGFGARFPQLGLSFWEKLDYVGAYFPSDTKEEELVSFDLIDNTMSLVDMKHHIKYLYHQQESIWNRIFTGYFSEKQLEQMTVANFYEGGVVFKK